ncbi:MAG: lycopene cyclase domain-containing protein [Verrucomicrobiia bacterium]
MTYADFLLRFLIFPILVLILCAWALRKGGGIASVDLGYHWRGVGILAIIAFVWTTPWDNYLIARGVWDSPEDRVVGRILYVPVEEYAFFVLMPIFNGALIYLLLGLLPKASSSWRSRQRWQRALAVFLAGVIFCAGLYALRQQSGTYLGLTLVWFVPPLLIQWMFDPAALLRGWRVVALGTLLPSLYFGLVDAYAIQEGIWEISTTNTTGLSLSHLPIEELLFFAITSLLLAQGLVLWHSLRSVDPVS